jgi:serine protease Do
MAKIPGRLRLLTGKQRPVFHCLTTSGAVATLVAVLAGASGSLLLAPPSALGAEIPAHATSFADMVERVKPAVLSVSVKFAPPKNTRNGESTEAPLDRFLRRYGAPNGGSSSPPRRPTLTGQGSGFFISADGLAVTNFHVVDNADYVGVTTDDGRVLTAKVVGADQRSDIAVIKVDGGGDFPFVRFADASPRVGDWVIAVGNPFGLGGTVTAGIVSARGRAIGTGAYDDLIQIDAAVNRGNSGGPTFDIEGNVIGVNTAIVSPTGGSVGIAFAIPAEDIKGVINQLRDKGKVIRGWIGVKMQDVNRDLAEELGLATTRGALVAEPEANGPAAKAGLAPGDVITAIEDKAVADSREAARIVSGLPPGTAAKFAITRDGQQKTIAIVLGTMPETREPSPGPSTPKQKGTSVPKLGASVAPQTSRGGAVVTDLEPGGVASDQGLRIGDVIVEAAGQKIGNAGDLRSAIEVARKSGRRAMLLRVRSGEGLKFITVPLGRV